MKEIKIFKSEIEDGIGELVKSTASIAYCSATTVPKHSVPKRASELDMEKLGIAKAENKDQIDLYYLESVLVSTGWNKNDDVFMSEATWEARSTPEDKQFNFMHNENDIIGHITGSYVLSKDGKKVEGDEKPEDFDIITQAVLYNSWTDPENSDRMGKIISEIEDGKWFVSMECLFAGFDYALTNKEGQAKVLARTEDSAFLTKHLRAYGGDGVYEGYKVGRALKNIAFSGKGLVEKPANPRSIIIDKNSSKAFVLEDTTSNFYIGDINMSDTSTLESQIAELKTALASTEQENKEIKAKIEEAKDKEFASQVQAFESQIEEKQASIAEMEETIKSTQAKVAELEDALAKSTQELTQATEAVAEWKKKEKQQKRMASLVDSGLDDEEAAESLASFDGLDDEAFESVVALMKKKYAKKEEDKDKEKDKDGKEKKENPFASENSEEEAATEATAEVFEDVETTEATLIEPVADEADELESARAGLSEWIGNHILSK
jgi:cell division protein FtsB